MPTLRIQPSSGSNPAGRKTKEGRNRSGALRKKTPQEHQTHTAFKPSAFTGFQNGADSLYPKARIPLDQTPIEFAMEQAAHTPLPPLPPEAEDFAKNDRICLLIKLLWQMSQNSSDGTFYLSCRDAARHIGQDHMTAHRWLGALRYLGLIELVEAGGNHFATGKTGTRAAATYRWKPYIGPKQLTSLQAIPA
jgi:hypothetical protein